MRISRVSIQNFRNFQHCDVELGQNIILIGENKAGKSNFLEALRLVLDPSLSDLDRQLTELDFWEGAEPFKGREITVTIQLTGFASESDPEYLPLSFLGDACIVQTEPERIAQLTYRYYNAKKAETPTESGSDDYEFTIYPGHDLDKKFNMREMRKSIPLQVIDALRDISTDIHVWTRSPLNRLLKLTDLDPKQLEPLAIRIRQISGDVLKLQPMSTLQGEIHARLDAMVGALYSVNPQLGLDGITARSLQEALRLYVDGDMHRPLERTSLGLQNALYLALLSLLLQKQQIKRTQKAEPYFPILAIEEPEAHLHPHLQRLVFDDFLEQARQRKQPVIVSTHSPHIASVAEVEDLVLFKDRGARGCEAKSARSFIASLEARARKDLNRFLDVTKAEMLFAKGVLFVEGDVEILLIDELAKILGKPLDRYGISVCSVLGAQFEHVVTLASKFGIPYVVLTDGDKFAPVTGIQRSISILQLIRPQRASRLDCLYKAGRGDNVQSHLEGEGFFVNDWTLEVTLLEVGLADELKAVFAELGDELGVGVKAGGQHIDEYLVDRTDESMRKVLASLGDARWGKARFAHRLVSHIRHRADLAATELEKSALVPGYIRKCIESLIAKVQAQRA